AVLIDQGVVAAGHRLALFNPALDVWQLDAQDSCLQGIQTRVPAKILVMVLDFHAMNAKRGQTRGPIWVIGNNHAGVAVGAEVLAGVETETTESAQGAGAFVLVFRAEGLGRILDDRQLVALRHTP